MKLSIITVLAVIIATNSYGQDRKDLTISFSSGILTSPYYSDTKIGGYYSFDMDYNLRKKHILSSNFTSGKHDYNDWISNVPGTKDFSNATASYKTFSFLYKYKIIDRTKVALIGGTGAGIMTHTRDYWRQEVNSTLRRQLAWSDLVFPLRLEANYKVSTHLQFGVIGGFLFSLTIQFLVIMQDQD